MKRGNLLTGTTELIPFKCTQCDFFDPMEIDIAEEVCDLVTVNGILCFSAYCIRCDSLMLPGDVLNKVSKTEYSYFSFFSVCTLKMNPITLKFFSAT